MIVILHDEDYEAWLSSTAAETRYFLEQYPAENLMVSI